MSSIFFPIPPFFPTISCLFIMLILPPSNHNVNIKTVYFTSRTLPLETPPPRPAGREHIVSGFHRRGHEAKHRLKVS